LSIVPLILNLPAVKETIIPRCLLRRGVVLHRRLRNVRREPDLKLAFFRGSDGWLSVISADSGILPADKIGLLQFSANGAAPPDARSRLDLRQLFSGSARAVVNRARVVRNIVLRHAAVG